nr:MAG TPA: hypothetical protein [Caudoviricetes sp.]
MINALRNYNNKKHPCTVRCNARAKVKSYGK